MKIINIFNKRNTTLLYLIIVGELIFALPFHVSRFFRPGLIEDYNYNNLSLGISFSIYGFTALICYVPGGYIADKIEPKYLLASSLLLTSLGGVVLLFNPTYSWLYFLYGYWGITTILFFWGALIKATRDIANEKQGLSFGALEGGRGLIASLCASLAVFIYSNTLLNKTFSNILNKDISSLSLVILFYTFITFFSSIMIFFFLQSEPIKKNIIRSNLLSKIIKNYKIILSIAMIVFTAYSGYKGIDYYSLYFYKILLYSKEEASLLTANLSYLRPISAVLAGIIADRISSRKTSIFLFLFLMISYSSLTFLSSEDSIIIFLFLNFIISLVAIFSLRGIFYSLLKETNIPVSITGISVGIISLVGYMPDIFIGPIFGFFLEAENTLYGFKKCFIFLLIISLLGYIFSMLLPKPNIKRKLK